MSHPYALPEPDGIATAATDGSVLELTRVWIGPNGPSILCRPAYEDPRAMGEMLAELCWHFAHAYEQRGGVTHRDALEALKAGWSQGQANGEAAALKRAAQ
ncbi:hypothetical protein BZG35_09900 [Brevundimonas sp. LM2]|uniref:DUF5076 domain-containing protein n=1 Tax=Brevundimonas sp. LM2 TaxID=1938605 RepID=UPI0009840491|nr:DUF5076 domain-containing protein [Brevundimonas sp. LM2]AQR61927.1 hypothetical protein BZG35_09900 [Brevundimonas sp. LM2]